MSKVLKQNKIIISVILICITLKIRAESLVFKDGQVTLTLMKNHNLIEGKVKAIGNAKINAKKSEISQLKIKLQTKTLQFKDKKDSDFFKSSSFFAAETYELMFFSSAKLRLSESKGDKQIFIGDMEVKIKNKSEVVKIQAELSKNNSHCLFEFPLVIKDRTSKLGLKFNSKKYSSEVELGENLIDDKLSFSFSLKCN